MNLFHNFVLLVSHYCSNNVSLSKSLQVIRSTYMINSYTAIFSSYKGLYANSCYISDAVIKEFSQSTSIILIDSEKFFPPLEYWDLVQPRNIIILVETELRNNFVNRLRMNRLWRGNSKILVFATNYEEGVEWIKILWQKTRASNVVSMTLDNLKYFTWFPYQPEECSDVKTITQVFENNLFPEKIGNNLNNCSLFVALSDIRPFVILPDDGSELLLIKTIAESLNLRKINTNIGGFFFKTLNQNGEPIGPLKFISDNKADVAISSMQIRFEYIPYAEMTRFHHQDYLSWFVSAPNYLTTMEKLLLAFDKVMWILVGVSLFSFTLVVALIVQFYYKGNKDVWALVLSTISAFLNYPIEIPNVRVLQIIMITLYVGSLHITTMFQSSLIYMLYYKITETPIRKVEEAIDGNFQFYFFDLHRGIINDSESSLWKKLDRKRLHNFALFPPFSDWKGENSSRKALLGPYGTMPWYFKRSLLFDSSGRSLLLRLNAPFMLIHQSMLMPLGHPLFPSINKQAARLVEGGFSNLWYYNSLEKDEILDERENKPLNFEALIGIFLLLLFGLGIALVLCLLEIIWHFSLKKQKSTLDKNVTIRNEIRKKRFQSLHLMFNIAGDFTF